MPQQTVDEAIDEFGSAMPSLADPNSLACLQSNDVIERRYDVRKEPAHIHKLGCFL
jgi:hypothetical protein